MEQIKINTIEELYNDENIKYWRRLFNINTRGLSNVDAREINLSKFPSENIKDIINCNLENTEFKIYLNDDFCITDSNIIGAHFIIDEKTNEKQHDFFNKTNVYLNNVMLDESQIKYLNTLYQSNDFQIHYDLNTILNNDGIVIDSSELLIVLKIFLSSIAPNGHIFKEKEMCDIVDKIEKAIVKDEIGNLKAVYDNIACQLSNYEKIGMFKDNFIQNITFENLEITEEIYDILKRFIIRNCNLKNITFKNSLNTMFKNYLHYFRTYNSIENTKMPNINYHSWQDIITNGINQTRPTRISSTPFTFMKNLYVELDRKCNAKCSFCRNDCMGKCEYNFENIINNLSNIFRDINNIFIGGGEPTINKEDLQKLLDICLSYVNTYIVSNGTASLDFYKNLEPKIYISRHHFDDNVNANIFGINKTKILSMNELSQLDNLTLSCTCINGGIDSVDKIIDYLQAASLCGVKNIVFSNLHDDASVNTFDSSYKNLNVKNDLFDEAINILKLQGFDYNYPVISSSGFKMYMLKNNLSRLRVAFKQYISKEELANLWLNAVKRTFDLSMAPDGTIYDNWAQDENKTKVLK